jgi:3-oxoacyl-[acyl-carrier protein] reductase
VYDHVFLVTGAAGGMGREIVKMFLEEGAFVVAADKEVGALSEMLSPSLVTYEVDLTNESAVKQLVQFCINRFGKIDGVINAAGIAQSATPIEAVDFNTWNQLLNVNLTSVFLLSKEVVPYMKKERTGVIVNIASISVERPRPGLNAYIASKAGLIGLTKALAIELAEYQIRVNAIHPGPTDTAMLGQFVSAGENIEESKKRIFQQSVPLGSLVKPSDIAHAVMYLCSEQARTVTGTVLNVDGGRGL